MATNGTTTSGAPPIDTSSYQKIGMQAYRAPSLLQPHRAREALADAHVGKIPTLVGFFLGVSSPPIAKITAQLGYDFVFVDWEHASTSVETMTQVGIHFFCVSELQD